MKGENEQTTIFRKEGKAHKKLIMITWLENSSTDSERLVIKIEIEIIWYKKKEKK